MLCNVKTIQKALTSGTKIDVIDIDISDDRIVMEDLDHVKQHLRDSAWTSLNQEGKVHNCNNHLHTFHITCTLFL